jgi:hypothetical protein
MSNTGYSVEYITNKLKENLSTTHLVSNQIHK